MSKITSLTVLSVVTMIIHTLATAFGFVGYGLSDKELYAHWSVGENMLVAGFR